jgi:hypothetical protein
MQLDPGSWPFGQTGSSNGAGLYVNEDLNDPLIAGGRNARGDEFFVYGTRTSDGAIGEIDSVLVRTADGQESFVIFELGRPVWLQGADGSYIEIVYNRVSPGRLSASATVFNAATGESQTVPVEIDLQRAADEVAQAILGLTGLGVEVPSAASPGTAKWQQRAVGPLVAGAIVATLVAASHLAIVITGQVMQAVFEGVAVAMQAAVVAAFMPLYLFSGMLGEVTVSVGTYPLLEIFVELPAPPQFGGSSG